MGKREKRKWRPLLSAFFIVRPPGTHLPIAPSRRPRRSPENAGCYRFHTVSLDSSPGRVRQISKQVFKPGHMLGYLLGAMVFPWPQLACKQPRN